MSGADSSGGDPVVEGLLGGSVGHGGLELLHFFKGGHLDAELIGNVVERVLDGVGVSI